ncbi:uncharacterized protein N7503_008043 [Penicillium pulvis]|uniref:uncharacterized protein n=1 Tax=Penicillium pulvis TaxID=1562058 RepID=UPI0025495F63|nr:uncharacterized protein N7503_008043 [Penicillium pulvis]KAJ5792065.1 hypothetical protein N7503_008043 [Penicillium pulvis]
MSQQERTRRLYLQGQLCNGALHAMFALASLFLGHAQTPSKWRQLDGISDIAPNARFHGQDWANNASHVVSLQLHAPSLDTVRSLSNLTTYWFGVGQWEKSQANANMVIQATRDLQLQNLQLPKAQSRGLRWSCFWADMMCRCFVLDDSFASSSQNIDISDITHTSDSLEPIGDETTDHTSVSLETHPTAGQEALLKTLGLWREARWFIRNLRFIHNFAPEADPAAWWAALFALDSKVTSCYSLFPSALRDFNRGRPHDSAEAPELLLSLHAVYHQCRALPHLAMFMFLRQTASASPEYVHLCARITVCHLNLFADVATSFMSFASSSASSSPPFIAYCAFLTASIHLAALCLFKDSTQILPKDSKFMLDLLRKRALSSLLLLQRLQSYWSSCRQLLNRLSQLCFSVGISTDEVESHGCVLREGSNFSTSTTANDSTGITPRAPGHEDLELVMTRHLANILKTVNISHPFYFSFQDQQSSHLTAWDSSSHDDSFSFSHQPYEAEAEQENLALLDTPAPLQPVFPASKSRPRHKPRTWIPARPVTRDSMMAEDSMSFLRMMDI